MTTRSTFAKASLAAAAGVMALSAAATASAQPYGAYAGANGGGYYDPCRRDSSNRGVVGALLGGAIGASVGANAGARKNRQDGALLGGALGAIGGAVVGNRSAACANGGQVPYNAPRSSYDGYNGYAPQYGYNDGAYAQPYGYDRRAERYGSRYDEDSYAYGGRGQRLRVAGGNVGADGCTLAE
uniref:hypothetical protein n=1 Tax=Phenylobacterium sp. TaxID=1871053 RepID=UPI003982F87B